MLVKKMTRIVLVQISKWNANLLFAGASCIWFTAWAIPESLLLFYHIIFYCRKKMPSFTNYYKSKSTLSCLLTLAKFSASVSQLIDRNIWNRFQASRFQMWSSCVRLATMINVVHNQKLSHWVFSNTIQ